MVWYSGHPLRLAEGVFFLRFGRSEHLRSLNSGTAGEGRGGVAKGAVIVMVSGAGGEKGSKMANLRSVSLD